MESPGSGCWLLAAIFEGMNHRDSSINEKTKEEIKGQWEVFKNGEPLLDESGNPITYPSNSQVGTKGFEYGF